MPIKCLEIMNSSAVYTFRGSGCASEAERGMHLDVRKALDTLAEGGSRIECI